MKATLIHALDDARAVLAAAHAGAETVMLISPPLTQAGLGWWRELLGMVRAEFPHARFEAAADCGPSAGLALAALRDGLGPIVADVPPDVLHKLDDIARQRGTRAIARDAWRTAPAAAAPHTPTAAPPRPEGREEHG